MSVVVFGSRGMLGWAVSHHFVRCGSEVVAVGRGEFDIASEPHERIEKFLRRGDVVINCAGVIKPRVSETSAEAVLRVNSIFPRNLSTLCAELGIPCFHITTDCVFSGGKGSYTERDLFDADDIYGMTKNAGEPGNCMVLRTSIIGEERGQARSLLEWARSQRGRQVDGFTNHRWNGVTTCYLAEVIGEILATKLYEPGIFHIFSPAVLTKFELLTLLNEVYELDLQIRPVEAGSACDRSLASIYPLSHQVAVKGLREQLTEMRRFFWAHP